MEFKEAIEKQYDECISRVNTVYSIFQNFFGEDRTDLQGVKSKAAVMDMLESITIGELMNRLATNFTPEEWEQYRNTNLTNLPSGALDYILNHTNVVKRGMRLMSESKPFILVWFPHVTVTNEHDRSTEIDNLYAKIVLAYEGTIEGRFSLNRATYTLQHMSSNYMHSHVCEIPFSDFTAFQVPCTGTGPINSTISSLCNEFDEDIWNLFCLELSKYVTVESISGTPYHYLEQLGTNNMIEAPCTYRTQYCIPIEWFNTRERSLSEKLLSEFIGYIASSKKLKFGYSDNSYVIGMPYVKVVAVISNLFIEWYNKKFNEYSKMDPPMPSYNSLLAAKVLLKCKFANNRLYTEQSRRGNNDYGEYIGRHMCIFKEKDITIDISDFSNVHENETLVLNPNIVSFIVWRILETLNYEYGNKDRRKEREKASREGGIIKRRRFL